LEWEKETGKDSRAAGGMAVTWFDGVGTVVGHFVVNCGKRAGLNAAGLAV